LVGAYSRDCGGGLNIRVLARLMRTAKVIIILLLLTLLGVMLFFGVRYNSTAKSPLSIQLAGVTNYNSGDRVVQFRISNPRRFFTFLQKVRVEDDSTSPVIELTCDVASYSTNQNIISINLSAPLSAYKTYRVVANYRYRTAFEQKVFSGVERVPILARFVPPSRKVVATSETFVVKPELSGTNMDHNAN
jgi:hypothetical protein